MKKNITILCLVDNFKKNVAKSLADELEMIFADVEQILEYNLINTDMIQKAGQQYFDQEEQSTLKHIASYHNTIISLQFSTFNKYNNMDILKENSLIIYLALNYSDFESLNAQENNRTLSKINHLMFDDRDKLMRKKADIVVDIKNLDVTLCTNQIILAIDKYFNC